MTWYTAGSISLTNGATAITGVGTGFQTVGTINAGDILYAPDGKLYQIASVNSDLSVTLASAYQGSTASGAAYAIIPIAMLSSIASQVGALTTATNSLLTSVNLRKSDLDAYITSALAAQSAATSQVALAATQATLATSNGATQVALAATQAANALTARIASEAARDASTASWTAALAAQPLINPQVLMNPSTILVDLAIPSFYNASSVGPITIGEGVNVTINDSANWSILL